MTCKVCPPGQWGSLRPCRARMAQSDLIRDVERSHGELSDLIRDVEPGATSSIGWPSSLYVHDNRESRLSRLSGVVSRARRPSRFRHDVSRPLGELFAHIFGHSLVPLILLILGIVFLSSVIVQPYNYRQIADDSKLLSGIWFVVGFIGAVCSYKNLKCLKYIRQIVVILELGFVRSSATFMWFLSLSMWCNVCWRFTKIISKLLWVFGPFIRYVIHGR